MTNATANLPSAQWVRTHFPALAGPTVYLDNAGGSQMPRVVADAMHRYVTTSFVQLGADYDASRRATATVANAHRFLKVFMNACPPDLALQQGAGLGEVIIGPSTSQLCRMLADCYARVLGQDDEVVVCETGHESNVGPWTGLADRGVVVKHWKVDPRTGAASMESLRDLLTDRTRVVTFPHVSNILGDVVDVPEVTRIVHDAGARVVVDGVAFAPHRAIDVASWGCDWYVYSTYKVFGPHAAALFGRFDALAELTGPNHFFVPRDDVPRKFELGGANHESCAGILALNEYLHQLTGRALRADHAHPAVQFDRVVVEDAFALIEQWETALQERLMAYLLGHPRVRVIGPAHARPTRVCTISFVHASKPSRQVAQHCNARGLGCRFGNCYAYRLCQALGLNPAEGVVRVSLAHYNSPQEVDRLIACLDEVL